jgi:hypothetical protein
VAQILQVQVQVQENTINQVLTYNGNTKDSVTYTAISSDAGCTKNTDSKSSSE